MSAWDQLGSDILGEAQNDKFGRSMSLSADMGLLLQLGHMRVMATVSMKAV